MFTFTTRTSLRGVEPACKGANASLPCRQAYENAGKPVTLKNVSCMIYPIRV